MPNIQRIAYCDNLHCETPDEPIERISDYRIMEDNSILCTGCAELAYADDMWTQENMELLEGE
jgi:hypothetical protein